MKSLLHYFAVFALFICWFGQVKTIDGKTQNGAIFLISSVSEMTKQVQGKFTSNVNFGGDTSQEVDDGKKKCIKAQCLTQRFYRRLTMSIVARLMAKWQMGRSLIMINY